MAAKLIHTVDTAPILTSDLLRGVIEAAGTLQNWIESVHGTEEGISAGETAIARLKSIEHKARRIENEPIISDVLESLRESRMALRWTLKHSGKIGGGRMKDGSMNISELEDDDEDDDTIETGEDSNENSTQHMPKDVQLSIERASRNFWILFSLISIIILAGSIIIIIIHRERFKSVTETRQKELTVRMANIAQIALNILYDAMVANNDNVKGTGVSLAASILNEMSSRTDSGQDVATPNDNYLTEFRSAIQDFSNGNQVTAVNTPRAYGAICENNETYPIHRLNDIFSNQSIVLPILTPNECGNDATATGVFSLVVPSYVRYTNYITTYRRNLARMACFYHSGFAISVAVTHDREILQDYLLPSVTNIGRMTQNRTSTSLWNYQITLWCGLGLALCILLTGVILSWMMGSDLKHRSIIFPALVGFLTAGKLAAVYLISQAVFASALNNEILLTMMSLMEVIAGAMFSPSMVQYNTTDRTSSLFFETLSEGLLKGKLFMADFDVEAIPSSMLDVAKKVESTRICAFRRGGYHDIVNGYAVAASYVELTEMNYIVAEKLPPTFNANYSIVFIIGFAIIAAFLVFGYMRWSPLARLRHYAVCSAFFRYKIHPVSVRIFAYATIYLTCIGGIIGCSAYATGEVHASMTDLAQKTLVLLGAALRAGAVKDQCSSGCGMPDFSVQLYFTQTQSATDTYPVISFVMQDIPLPFPMQPEWPTHYLGAELCMNNIHTSLLNVPSFSTPLVNRTVNETEPRYLVRNMLSATGVNKTYGFTIERFPESYSPGVFAYVSYSIGICGMLALASIVVVICEMQYLDLHQRFKKGQSLYKPYFIIIGLVALIFVSFIAYGVGLRFVLSNHFDLFTKSELSFMVSTVSYRLGLLSLDLTGTYEETVAKLVQAVSDSSMSTMLMGSVFNRFRILEEYGSEGQVIVHGVNNDKPCYINRLDQGYIPVCGKIAPEWISIYASGTLNYCYVEIPQGTSNTETSTRLFVLAATTVEMWERAPMGQIWPSVMGVCAIIGCLVVCIIGLILFSALHTAHSTGYTILMDREMVSFSEPLPTSFSVEFFLPRRQRILWIGAIFGLGIIVLYFTLSAGYFLSAIDEAYQIAVSHESQSQLLAELVADMKADALNYIVFPFPSATINNLRQTSNAAAAGTLTYVFMTEDGLETFQEGLMGTYYNLSSTNNALNSALIVANQGYGSFTSYIASTYESQYIMNQESTFTQIDNLVNIITSDVNNNDISVNYEAAIQFLYQIITLRELLRKLFVLDHMAITSYADFGLSSVTDWPSDWAPPSMILALGSAAKSELVTRINSALSQLKTTATQASATSKNTVTDLTEQISEFFSRSYALESFSSSIWSLQQSRCSEIISSGNKTQEAIAEQQEVEQIASIMYLYGNMTVVQDEELSARKTWQMIKYLRTGQPLSDVLTMQAWQRWMSLKQTKRMYDTGFGCAITAFVVMSGCILLHFYLLRRRVYMIQADLTSSSSSTTKNSLLPSSNESDAPVQKKLDDSITPSASASGKLKTPDSLEKGSPIESFDDESRTAEVISLIRTPKRRRRNVILVVTFFLLVTLVPLCCCFWLITLAMRFVNDGMQDLSTILSLYTKVQSIFETITVFMERSAEYYTSVVSPEEMTAFLNQLKLKTMELGGAYKWDLTVQEADVVTTLYTAFDNLYNSITYEMQVLSETVPTVDIENYYTPQSAYARATLSTLSGANTYATLIPMSANTDGSPLNVFSEIVYNNYFTQAQSPTITAAEFATIFADYSQLCSAINKVSEAQLTLWHAIVAGGREEGAAVATKYGDFTTLVGGGALSPIQSSTQQPEGADAASAITSYYQTLLDNYDTTALQTDLFTNTDSAPSTAADSPFGAYEAAGYVSSYLSKTITQAKFSNLYGYNRNLTSKSSFMNGKKSMLEYLNDFNVAVRDLFLDVGTVGQLQIVPALINRLVWYTQVTTIDAGTRDHADLDYLGDAARWCCVCTFWGLLVSCFLGMYMTYLL